MCNHVCELVAVLEWLCTWTEIHTHVYTCIYTYVHIFLETGRQREKKRQRQGWHTNRTVTTQPLLLSSHNIHMSAHTYIYKHSTSMLEVFCTFQTLSPLFWILLPAAAICACLHDGHTLASGCRQPCAGPGWLHFSVHCAEHHPWQMVSTHTHTHTQKHIHTHTHTHCPIECVLLCVYTWLFFKWVSVWCLLIINSMMLRHVWGTTQEWMQEHTLRIHLKWNMERVHHSKRVCLSSGWVTGVKWTWIA